MPLLRRATDDSQQDLFERDKAPWDKKIEPEAAGDLVIGGLTARRR